MTAALGDAPSDQAPEVQVAVLVDADVVARLEHEGARMWEDDLQLTARRRLELAGRLLSHLQRADLLWAPLRKEQRKISVTIAKTALDELRAQAERLDIAEPILLSGVLADKLFASPLAMFDHDESPSGYLRTERGRGRIYNIQFEVAGFEYAFLKAVGGQDLAARDVFSLAITSLAERLGRGDPPSGLRLSREALSLASDIALRARRSPPPRPHS